MLCHAIIRIYKITLQTIQWRIKYNGCTYSKNLITRLRVRAPVKPLFLFFIFFFALEFFRDLHVCRKKSFGVLCTCKATSLSKLAKLVWRYSDDARAIIENVYKFCMEEKKSGRKLSLNRVWDRTAALMEEKKKAHDEQQQPKQPPSSTVDSVTW